MTVFFLAALTLPALGDMVANLSAADWVDIGCVATVVLAIGLGAHRGLAAELPLSVGWICGGLAGWYAYVPAVSFFKGLEFFQGHPEYAIAVTVLAVVLLAWGAMTLVQIGLSHLSKRVANQPIDHVLGIVFGLLRALLLLLLVAIAMLLLPWRTGHEVFCHASRVGRIFTPLAAEILAEARSVFPDIDLHRATDPGEEIAQVFRGGNRATNTIRRFNPPAP